MLGPTQLNAFTITPNLILDTNHLLFKVHMNHDQTWYKLDPLQQYLFISFSSQEFNFHQNDDLCVNCMPFFIIGGHKAKLPVLLPVAENIFKSQFLNRLRGSKKNIVSSDNFTENNVSKI